MYIIEGLRVIGFYQRQTSLPLISPFLLYLCFLLLLLLLLRFFLLLIPLVLLSSKYFIFAQSSTNGRLRMFSFSLDVIYIHYGFPLLFLLHFCRSSRSLTSFLNLPNYPQILPHSYFLICSFSQSMFLSFSFLLPLILFFCFFSPLTLFYPSGINSSF